jgi:hypothetical protein
MSTCMGQRWEMTRHPPLWTKSVDDRAPVAGQSSIGTGHFIDVRLGVLRRAR